MMHELTLVVYHIDNNINVSFYQGILYLNWTTFQVYSHNQFHQSYTPQLKYQKLLSILLE